MKKLFFDKNNLTGLVTDKRFLELEIKRWLDSPERKAQIAAERYYEGYHDILDAMRTMVNEDGELEEVTYLPNNKIIDNRYAYQVDQLTNFEMGQPITFDTDLAKPSGKQFADELNEVFNKEKLGKLRRITKHAVNEGIAWLYVWPRDGKLEFSIFHASEVLPFWADAEHTDLDCAVRLYSVLEYNEEEQPDFVFHVEVYDGNGITRFIWSEGRLEYDYDTPAVPYLTVQVGKKTLPYAWERMPLIAFKANEGETPLLNKCKTLQDALNKLLSDFQNVTEENNNKTILIIKNYDGTDLGEFKRNLMTYGAIKVRTVDGVDGGVDSLTVEVDANNYKIMIDMLRKAIIENCGGFDAKDERLSNNPNQMNIQSMYADIEITANGLETEFAASFEQLLWFVRQHLKQTGKGNFENEKADVIFNRDMLLNEGEAIDNCTKMVGLVSKETIMKQIPCVDDPKAEMDRLAKEQETEMPSDPYAEAFHTHTLTEYDQ